jgi:hypothetical protein
LEVRESHASNTCRRQLTPCRLFDIIIGDPIWPAPRTIDLPRLLGGTISLSGYPMSMVYAEKITTAVQRGTVNTRWRDFADLYLLSSRHAVDGEELHRALAEVAAYRTAELAPLTDVLDGYAAIAQARWAAWRRKKLLEDRLRPPSPTFSMRSSLSPTPSSRSRSLAVTGSRRLGCGPDITTNQN